MAVPLLRQGDLLIASIQAALSDADLRQMQDDLLKQVRAIRAQGVIIDVTAVDVIDSFAARTLRTTAQMLKLRGSDTVIVGLQPDIAFAMVQLGLRFDGVRTALDLEEGLILLRRRSVVRHG
jgi:rsbT antagonist protein RsbS